MTEMGMAIAYFGPMLAVLGIFWNVARRLGAIEADVKHVREDNVELRSEMRSMRDLVSVFLDAGRSSR
jgi:hypothetical protein